MLRRFILILAVLILAGVGLVTVLSLLSQTPQELLSTTPTPSDQLLATVNGEGIPVDFWAQQHALDQVMNRLSGQPIPTSQQTLDRLINERLLLQAYPTDLEFSDGEIVERIEILEAAWHVDQVSLTAQLEAVGLSWQIFTHTVERLLYVEAAREQLLVNQGLEVWLVDARAKAQIHIDEGALAKLSAQ